MAERLQKLQQELSQDQQKTELEFTDEGRVGIIYLNAPKELNALSDQMRKELSQKINALSQNPIVKVIVLLSKVEKAFCAGANIKEFGGFTYQNQTLQDSMKQLDQALSECVKPIICGANGVIFGGGFEVALASDILILQEGSKLGLPETNIGIIPGMGGTIRLTKLVGQKLAMKIILSAQPITDQQALQYGIASDIFKKENFHEQVINQAKLIAQKSMFVLTAAKKSIQTADEMGTTQAKQMEKQLVNTLCILPGKKEGYEAFVNKRKPNFNDI
ncbi:hypothetical protein PPERSA_09711 [Pseudocohnilembus persalinus]|uniref:ClpP/crotonase-like domain n=1 Tax=Pseudocohnilembus persalinus TaxID=266149 RepID=A0A0V0QUK3_PSEPJ|nr:hypothetical protein PPERSA_09711 [Pseudocohnilembus persalinus]|eukprot:KRX06099.1 hypothetical protein PPERSA_09711 [Pseudocohnilembus persalinus]